MTVYLAVFLVLASFAVLMELNLTPKARLTLFWTSYVILVVFVGLRWETGNDWSHYYEYYIHLSSLRDDPYVYEIGYRLFSVATKSIGLPFAGFNLLFAAAYLGLMFLSFKHEIYRASGWLILQLFAPFIMGLMGTTRQVMAMAICMFSVRYLLSRQWLRFLICVALATLFHYSALTFLLAWPLARVRITARRLVILIVVLPLLMVLGLGNLLVNFVVDHAPGLGSAAFEHLLALETEATPEQFNFAAGSSTLIWFAMGRLAVLALLILAYRLFSEETDRLYLKFYLMAFAMLSLLSGPVFVIAERASLYFSIFQMHLIALPTVRLKRRWARQVYCGLLILISLARLYSGIYLRNPKIFVPYKGVIINRDVERELWWFE